MTALADAPPMPPVEIPPTRSKRRSGRIWAALAVVVAAVIFLTWQGLGNATVYFYTADEAVARKEALGEKRFRIEGAVVPGSVRETKAPDGTNVVEFEVMSAGVRAPVRHVGNPPELFQPGIPVVLEGQWDGDVYASDTIMVKHTTEYKAENPERVQDYVGEGSGKAGGGQPGTIPSGERGRP